MCIINYYVQNEREKSPFILKGFVVSFWALRTSTLWQNQADHNGGELWQTGYQVISYPCALVPYHFVPKGKPYHFVPNSQVIPFRTHILLYCFNVNLNLIIFRLIISIKQMLMVKNMLEYVLDIFINYIILLANSFHLVPPAPFIYLFVD